MIVSTSDITYTAAHGPHHAPDHIDVYVADFGHDARRYVVRVDRRKVEVFAVREDGCVDWNGDLDVSTVYVTAGFVEAVRALFNLTPPAEGR